MSILTSTLRSVALLVAAAVACPASAAHQALSPFSDIASLSAEQLAGAQVRFTFVGVHSGRGLPSVAFTTAGTALDLSGFAPYHRPGLPYEGDSSVEEEFSVSTTDLRAMVDSVATLPQVTDGGVDSLGYISFGIYCVVGGEPRCFESVVDVANGTALFSRVLGALAGNDAAVKCISDRACMYGMLPSPEPIIVDDRVQVTLRGFRRVRGTKEFVGRVRLTNTSSETLAVPLAVALGPPLEMKVLNPVGFTCYIQPGGIPYLRFPATSPLTQGQSTEVVVRLLNPNLERVRMDFIRTFADSGGH